MRINPSKSEVLIVRMIDSGELSNGRCFQLPTREFPME
jgi:hypothetical protein